MVMANGDGGGTGRFPLSLYTWPCTCARVRVCVYRDSSLKIQMEYRAFEERSARGGGARWRMEAGGAQGRARTVDGVGKIFQKSNIDQSCQSYPL